MVKYSCGCVLSISYQDWLKGPILSIKNIILKDCGKPYGDFFSDHICKKLLDHEAIEPNELEQAIYCK